MKIASTKRGRPKNTGKINEAIIEKICSGVRNGLTFKDSAKLAGIDNATFYRWRDRGEKQKKGVYRNFCDALEIAMLQAKQFHLNVINKSAQGFTYDEVTKERNKAGEMVEVKRVTKTVKGDPNSAKWMLERRHPEEFGPQLTLNGEAPVVEMVYELKSGTPKTTPLDVAIEQMNSVIMEPPEDVV